MLPSKVPVEKLAMRGREIVELSRPAVLSFCFIVCLLTQLFFHPLYLLTKQ